MRISRQPSEVSHQPEFGTGDSAFRIRGAAIKHQAPSVVLIFAAALVCLVGCGKVGIAPEFKPECTRGETRACDCGGGIGGISACVFNGEKNAWGGCGQCGTAGGDDGVADAGTDGGGNCGVEGLPAFSTSCLGCHDANALGAVQSDENAGPRDWAAARGAGLVRFEPAMPSAATMLDAPGTKRGRHSTTDLDSASCAGCHPIREDGLGHGTKTYPLAYRGTPFQGGVNCAGACHAWLNDKITAAGFAVAGGSSPEYSGSARPDALLAVSTAHKTIWQSGYRSASPWLKIGALNPGCGGCHHAQSEKHGEVPACTACHRFGGAEGEPHKAHVERIASAIDTVDPNRPQMTECAYCHDEGDAAKTRSNAVCHNCHLSGHQPLDANARAHFWNAQ